MLTLIRGNDAYLVAQAADKAAPGSLRINCLDENADELLERVTRYTPLFDDYVVAVCVDGTGISATAKKTIAFAQDKAEKTITIEPPTGQLLLNWIATYCHERNAAIDPAATVLLARWIPADFWRLSCELDKLITHSAPVTEQLVRELVAPPKEQTDPWAFTQAIKNGDKRRTLTAAWHALGEGAAPELLVGMAGAGLRPLIVAGNERALAAHTALSDLDRASKWGAADAVDGLFAIVLSI